MSKRTLIEVLEYAKYLSDKEDLTSISRKIDQAIEGVKDALSEVKNVVDRIRAICEQVSLAFHDEIKPELIKLLLGTVATESDFIFRRQKGGGPARGIVQMEIATARDIIKNYLQYRPNLWYTLRDLSADFAKITTHSYHMLSDNELEKLLINDDVFSIAMARLKYLRASKAIPRDLKGIAEYYKRIYNTSLGKGNVELFIDKYNKYVGD